MQDKLTGSCLCGKVAYAIAGPITGINFCHCRQCRKASGTAFATNAGVARENFSVLRGQSHLTGYESSPGKRRVFCASCGSPLYSERHGGKTVYVRLGTLDDELRAIPDVHIHVASKAPWYEINDDIPQLEEEEGIWF